METQYYDRNDNYIEIPALALPAGEENDAVDAINAALNDLRSQYGDLLDNSYGFVEGPEKMLRSRISVSLADPDRPVEKGVRGIC